MITVTYLPAYENTPFKDNETQCVFQSHEDFKEFVRGYVCNSCLKDFKDFCERDAVSVADYLDMGCGCEIDIEDPNNLIRWDESMICEIPLQ